MSAPNRNSLAPDFLIIGAMKCGTTTLHDQLARQAGVFMTTPKEPNFFSDDEVFARGEAWYRALFEGAQPGDLRGESSTHYTKLPTHPRTMERLRVFLGERPIRVIYIMRRPTDRLVSHYIHAWSERETSAPIEQAVRDMPRLVDYGRYAMQLDPWLEWLGPERVLPVFFERMAARPQETLERVWSFLGLEGAPRWDASLGASNVSSARVRKSPLREFLVSQPALRWARRAFVPKSWRDRVKKAWSMNSRPELSAPTKAALERVFDDDLARVGRWMGVSLTCENFKGVATSERALEWAPRAEVARA